MKCPVLLTINIVFTPNSISKGVFTTGNYQPIDLISYVAIVAFKNLSFLSIALISKGKFISYPKYQTHATFTHEIDYQYSEFQLVVITFGNVPC